MLITKIYLAAMSRADVNEKTLRTLPNFYLFVDEFQSFANESFADILSEARKYKLNLTIAHQYIEQMEDEVRAAVFGNVGTMIVFRVGAYDAEVLEKEFAPTFTAEDIVNLGFTQIYLKLMIDGVSSQPFSATSMPPIKPPEVNRVAEVVAMSREQFAHKRAEVEQTIADWHLPVAKKPSAQAPAQVGGAPAGAGFTPAQSHSHSPQSATAPRAPHTPPHYQKSAPAHAAPHSSAPSHHTNPHQDRKQYNTTAPHSPAQPKSTATPFKAAFDALNAEQESVSLSSLSQAPHTHAHVHTSAPSSVPAHSASQAHTTSHPQAHTAGHPQTPAQAHFVKNDQKKSTPKNVNELKNALASVLGTIAPKTEMPKVESPKGEVPKAEAPKNEQPQPPKAEIKQEIPKETLDALLKVE